MKEKVLRILRNSSDYISGQDLCQALDVSRTAIWKVINKLKEEGYQIEAINNKGYKITVYPDIVTEAELLSVMNTKMIGRQVIFKEQITSTNTEAKRYAEEGASEGTLVITNEQTMGKGRRGRQWESQDNGIYMSLILKPHMEPIYASMLTLIAAVSVFDALKDIGIDSAIKWPNDLLIKERKVCGILTEMSADMDHINYVIVGIGINMNAVAKDLEHIATYVNAHTERKIRRAPLIRRIMEYFEGYYQQFLIEKNVAFIKEHYNQALINNGRMVKILGLQSEQLGIAKGINDQGSLVVNIDGKDQEVMAGEVSVRGILGYV